MRPCIPLVEIIIPLLRLAGNEGRGPAAVIVKLNIHEVKGNVVDDVFVVPIWERALRCSGEIVRFATSRVHQGTESVAESCHVRNISFKVKVEPIDNCSSEGTKST